MTGAIVVLALLALASAGFVARPLLRVEPTNAGMGGLGLARARELDSRHRQLLASLRDLEDDRVMEKVDDEDYKEMRARLSAEAITVMRELDALKDEREAAAEAVRRGALPLRRPGVGRPGPRS